MRLVLRTVAGRKLNVTAEPTELVSDLLKRVCTDEGYRPKGSRLVRRGARLDPGATLGDCCDDRDELVLVAAKGVYVPPEEGTAASPGSPKTPARERAAVLDLTGAQYDGPLSLSHRRGMAQLADAMEMAGGRLDEEFEGLLRIHPAMTHLRVTIQADNSLLAPILKQVQAISPPLLEAIGRHQEAFLRILNAPVGRPGGGGDDTPEMVPMQLWQEGGGDSEEGEGSEEGTDDARRGEVVDIELTPEDVEAVMRIVQLGQHRYGCDFPRELVVQFYIDAGRNEHLTAQSLVDLVDHDPLGYHLAARQATLSAQRAQAQSPPSAPPPAPAGEQPHPRAEALRIVQQAARGSPNALSAERICSALEDCLELYADPSYREEVLEVMPDACRVAARKAPSDLATLVADELLALCKFAALCPDAGGQLLRGGTGLGPPPGVSLKRLRAVAAREGADCVLVHFAGLELRVWHVRAAEKCADADAVILRTASTLSAADAEALRQGPAELRGALTATGGTAPLRAWAALHRMYGLIFGEDADWLPRRVHFASTMLLPFHALAPHGGVAIGRGRVVTQSPTLLWLEHAQRLAATPAAELRPSGGGPLRCAAARSAPPAASARRAGGPRLSPQRLVPVSELGPREGVAVWHCAADPQPERPPGPVDLAVTALAHCDGEEEPWNPYAAQWNAAQGAPWACSACVPLLHFSQPLRERERASPTAGGPGSAPSAPRPPPPRGGGVGVVLCRLLGEGRRKAEAYAAAVAAASEGPPRDWAQWVYVGTSLPLGGRRAHVDPQAVRHTQAYRFLDKHQMHKVFDEMARFLLSERPEDPLQSLVTFMEANQEGLQRLGQQHHAEKQHAEQRPQPPRGGGSAAAAPAPVQQPQQQQPEGAADRADAAA
eukprot:TRINITY_DN18635_c0_g2_i1.p1 TRINITY_DN18635_c0_g2~~TRINITY_DN18635_c0_g2_i1.p1  ORF type:complete len:917 (+),score=252.69 TRINITY_DN18635_c0_g2_i1:84-2753(+)